MYARKNGNIVPTYIATILCFQPQQGYTTITICDTYKEILYTK